MIEIKSFQSSIVEDVAEEMCSHYCKYPETWNTERDGDLYESEICKNCPLGRLCA